MQWYNIVILIVAFIGFYKSLKDLLPTVSNYSFPEHKDPPEESE